MKKRLEKHQNIESFIANGVELKGELNSKGSIRLDGLVEGKINIQGDLIVGEKGFIKGEVRAESMVLAGKVEGNINTKGRLEITASGSLLGDVVCSVLIIQEGATLDGHSKMSKIGEKIEASKLTEFKKNR